MYQQPVHPGFYYSRQSRANIITLTIIQFTGPAAAVPAITLTGDDGSRFRAENRGNNQYRITGNKPLRIGVEYRIEPLKVRVAVPKLLMAKQIAKNQVELVYDRPCNLESAVKVTNYWIRVNRKQPVGIGTVGEDGKLTAGNSLQPQNSAVAPADQSKMRFILTFSKQAAPGVIHEVLPCFVSQDGHSGYRGENWDQTSDNQFTGR